jgi:hypothetical protein
MYIGLREKNGALGLADVRRETPRDFNEAALSPSLTKGSNAAALQKGSATYNLWRHWVLLE